ncbi:MAG: hypothetical protein ACE15B_19150 [Bryobacteraceae bacterium]
MADIAVVFTSAARIMAAMGAAAELARRTGARITLLVPCVVPFPLPLTEPPVLLDWIENRVRRIVEESPVETCVRFYLCRDGVETLAGALEPYPLVVLAGRKRRWWRTAEEKLACRLERAGHRVVFAETA